jgi:hypothetical protein
LPAPAAKALDPKASKLTVSTARNTSFMCFVLNERIYSRCFPIALGTGGSLLAFHAN